MCAAVSFGSGASVRVSKECVAAIEAVRQADLENDETVCCVLSYRPVENELQVVDLFGDNSLESAIESLNPAALQFIFCCLTDSINTGLRKNVLVQYVGEAAVESVKVAAVQHMSTQHVSSLLSNTCAIPTHLTITARCEEDINEDGMKEQLSKCSVQYGFSNQSQVKKKTSLASLLIAAHEQETGPGQQVGQMSANYEKVDASKDISHRQHFWNEMKRNEDVIDGARKSECDQNGRVTEQTGAGLSKGVVGNDRGGGLGGTEKLHSHQSSNGKEKEQDEDDGESSLSAADRVKLERQMELAALTSGRGIGGGIREGSFSNRTSFMGASSPTFPYSPTKPADQQFNNGLRMRQTSKLNKHEQDHEKYSRAATEKSDEQQQEVRRKSHREEARELINQSGASNTMNMWKLKERSQQQQPTTQSMTKSRVSKTSGSTNSGNERRSNRQRLSWTAAPYSSPSPSSWQQQQRLSFFGAAPENELAGQQNQCSQPQHESMQYNHEKHNNDKERSYYEWANDQAAADGGGDYVAPDTPLDTGVTVIALYDYEAADDTEISFRIDDVITSVEKLDVGWWRGVSNDGLHIGLFPANYVQLLT